MPELTREEWEKKTGRKWNDGYPWDKRKEILAEMEKFTDNDKHRESVRVVR